MFQDSLVESSGQLKSKSSRYVWITGSFNAAVVAVMILVPLLYPEALPKTAMTAMLSAPPPPPAPAPPQPATATRAVKPVAPLDAYTAPPAIPRQIDMTYEDPPSPTSGTTVAGMTGPGNGSSNVMGALNNLGLDAPPPVVRAAIPKPAQPARVSSGVMAGQILSKIAPAYPPIAKAAHVSGAVVLHAIISKTGAIQSLSVISGPEMLRANAVAAVQEWRYRPYLLNGDPTEVDTTITVNFSFGG